MHDETRRTDRYGYLICLVMFLSYLLVFFHRVSPSVLALDMQRAFGVGGALLGLLGSAYFYPYALMQLPVGSLMDNWGVRNTVAVSLLIAAAGSALMGLAQDILWAIVGRFLVGMGVSAIYVANYKLLGEWFSTRRMVLLGGLFMTVGGIGIFIAGPPLAAVSGRIGWRWALGAVAGITVIMAGLDRLVVRDRPAGAAEVLGPGAAPAEAAEAATPAEAAVPAGIALPGPAAVPGPAAAIRVPARPLSIFREILGCGRFWPVAAWGGLAAGVSFAVGSMWGVPYLQHVYGMSSARAGGCQSTFGLALIFGGPLFATLANRLGRRPVAIGASALLALCLAIFVLFTERLPVAFLYGLFFCFYLAGNANGPLAAVMARELFRPSIAGTSMGLVNFFPFFFGGLYQVAMGIILDRGGRSGAAYTPAGYRWIFLLGLASALLSLGAAFLIREPGRTALGSTFGRYDSKAVG